MAWAPGHAFIAVGIIAILIATIRFVRTGWLLDDTAVHSPGILADLAFGVTLRSARPAQRLPGFV